MADYPTFGQQKGSKRKILDGMLIDRSENGYPRKRLLFSKSYYEFEIKHILKADQWQELLEHYEAHKKLSFNFQWAGDGQIYLVEYFAPPEEAPERGGRREVKTFLRTV